MLVGTDGYPMKDKNGDYFMGGGESMFFKATAVEFYGMKK
jgi:hypothetical protein